MDLIHNISETALWVASFRADETERPDAVFKDPFARKLAGPRGKEIAESIQFSKQNRWSFVARTWLFDEMVKNHLAKGGDMVINLAAGLDARPYRMELPSSFQWVDIDLPEITAYKAKILEDEKPKCKFERIVLDLADVNARKKVFHELASRAKNILVMTEGLIVYLTDEQNAELAKDLSSEKTFRYWTFDIVSPGLLNLIKKEMSYFASDSNTSFKFAPEKGEDFFINYGWKPIETHSLLKTAHKLDRLPPEMLAFADYVEPEGPKGEMPWSGVCLVENVKRRKRLLYSF